MTCPACQAANPAGTLFCVCCSLPLPPAALSPGPAPGASLQAAAPAPLPPGPAPAARGLRLVAVENLQPTGFVATLPDTAYTGELLLGRSDLAAGVVVDVEVGGREQGVSRRHARLCYDGALVRVADWASAHGTWLNKTRLADGELAPLADGDELRLAGLVFRVELR